MISILNGTLIEATAGSAVIDVNGIGFELGISATTASQASRRSARPLACTTRMVVREDSMHPVRVRHKGRAYDVRQVGLG
ncbi:MAG: OB-fold domain-containing protein [Collinsella sp.]